METLKIKVLPWVLLFFLVSLPGSLSQSIAGGVEGAALMKKNTESTTEPAYEKPADEKIRKMLTPEQYEVTQHEGTERAFHNQYWDNHEAGIYVDIVTGEPLFSSIDKFDSGTGWPSFTRPVVDANIAEKVDRSFMGERTEVHSKQGHSHLGHLFPDGPADRGGMRYCINSAALKFIPVSKLKENGYEQFLPLFSQTEPVKAAPTKSEAHLSLHGLYFTKNAAKNVKSTEVASFAAGCFWGVEQEFRKLKGVVATAVGFMGGHTPHPTYQEVCNGDTGYAETVQIEFDPTVISYSEILDLFWHLHDPTTVNRQGPDVGDQYRSAIFYNSPKQKAEALATRDELQKSGELKSKVVTEIVPAAPFYKAEDYHQQYVEKGGHAACHFRRKKVDKK